MGETTSNIAKNAIKVLMVDADKSLCELVKFRLGHVGFEISAVHDGHSALKMDLSAYDILLVDLMDADFNGINFIEALRAIHAYDDIPVLIHTSFTDKAFVVRSLDAGADDYVVKPIPSQVLIARINSVMRRRGIHALQRGKL